MSPEPITFDHICQAAAILDGHAAPTPLLESARLNDQLGGRLLLKAECLQRTGSFKFRGAYHFLSRLAPDVRAKGVVAFSSGNHAQGVAAAARLFDTTATIVMPRDAPSMKIENTKAFGASVVLYDRLNEDREAIGKELAEKTGATLVPPFDHPWIIAGQGTVGLEIAQQAADLGAQLDAVVIPCSGGGLSAGCALALAAQSPKTTVHTAEPNHYDDTARSLAAKQPLANDRPAQPSICDALLLPQPGRVTFPILMALQTRGVVGPGAVVSDDQARAAMAVAFEHFKVVLEPGGAVALAAVLSGAIAIGGRTVAVVGSGGNADPQIYRASLGHAHS